MKCSRYYVAALLFAAPAALQSQAPRDSLDAFVLEQIARRQVAGLSLAIIDGGRIVVAKGYGVRDLATRAPVTATTLFQAGSISKPVSALGALHLVEAGRLSLDGDVNAKLTSWKVPESPFTEIEKVTLRRLLSHSAGVTVHGFPGYDVTDPYPTLVQVLDGAPPANNRAIRVDTTPGAIWRYSGGGFTIMQQMMIDVTGTPFPRFMQKTVLGPIGMTESGFDQPQSPARAARTASGYYDEHNPVRGRWHLYPEMAAAGLWTTASDLARFAIEIQQTLAGKGHGVISPAMARQYVTEQKGGSGLGIAVEDSGSTLRFGHGGRDEGFDAFLYADAAGHGIAIMINANDNSRLMGRIMNQVAQWYHWPQATWKYTPPAVVTGVPVDSTLLFGYAGYYEFAENQMQTLVPTDDRMGIDVLVSGIPDERFLPTDSVHFGSNDRGVRLTFIPDAHGEATGLTWRVGEPNERRVARVAPLPSTRHPVPDPDTALTRRSVAALAAVRQAGAALAEAPDITPGAKRDFAGGVGGQLDGVDAPDYLGEEDVSDRGIHRHGHDVSRVRYYAVMLGGGQRYVFVYLTAGGLVTDYDVVAE